MTTKPSSMTLGILASILAALLFTLMDVSAKAVSYLGTGELTFVRGLVGLFFLPLIAKRESLPLFSGKDRLLLHTRGIFGGMGILLFFFCLKGLTLGDAEILVQLAAFFMCILSPIFLATTPSGQVRVWLFIIALGAAVVLRIWDYSSFNGYALVGIVSAFCSACAYTCIGRLNEKGGHSGGEIVFYFQFYSMAGGLLLMLGEDLRIPDAAECLWLFALSFSAIFAQVCFTWGGDAHPSDDRHLRHVHRRPLSYRGGLGALGRGPDHGILDRRRAHRSRKRDAIVEIEGELVSGVWWLVARD